ncbi:DUF7519 family protein [Natronococcus wangiae]|uniref:DUF7519 family protein n=1 Tax=Natronococcus wangiae TaxID=3068275 RepID=UPI00273DE066|nr:hypothetical protein [Natronococcus sp. AD5]
MTEITRRPAVRSSAVAGAAAFVAVVAAGIGSVGGVAFAAFGLVILATGLIRGHGRSVDAGGLVLFFGVVAGGLETNAVEPTVVGTIATVVAWDVAHGAIDVGDQLGREAETTRLEAVQVVSSLLVGLLSGTAGYAVYAVGADGQPVAAVVLLVVAAVLIVVGFGGRRSERSTRRRRQRTRGR